MKWSTKQDQALKSVSRWLNDFQAGKAPQVFRLFGYAGTGKTTLAKYFAEGVSGTVLFGAFTGKAAHVLRSKGCSGATTIHSMIYTTRTNNEDETPRFRLDKNGDASKASLIIIDECSMVDEQLGKDLLSFEKPVLVLGDPAQLPPVQGGGYFTEADPDIMLTEVHRQAQGNPIIRLSMLVREGGELGVGDYGQSQIINRKRLETNLVLETDQILVGLNRTRHKYNCRLRELLDFVEMTPQADEKLVCLRNNHQKGLLNGANWVVTSAKPTKDVVVKLGIRSEEGRNLSVRTHRFFFTGEESQLSWAERRDFEEFTFGYALTVHKAQGSQWDNVLIFDESSFFRENNRRWLYTAITRASERLTIVC